MGKPKKRAPIVHKCSSRCEGIVHVGKPKKKRIKMLSNDGMRGAQEAAMSEQTFEQIVEHLEGWIVTLKRQAIKHSPNVITRDNARFACEKALIDLRALADAVRDMKRERDEARAERDAALDNPSAATARTLRDFANNPGGHFSNPELEAAGRAIWRIVQRAEKAEAALDKHHYGEPNGVMCKVCGERKEPSRD